MGKGVCIETHIEISFGLDIYRSVNSFIETAKEVIMEHSNAILKYVLACAWCGAAFLRSLVEKTPTQARDVCASKCVPSKSERGRFDSFPPHPFLKALRKQPINTDGKYNTPLQPTVGAVREYTLCELGETQGRAPTPARQLAVATGFPAGATTP